MAIRVARIALAVLVCGLLAPAGAVADGDPASDTLLGQNVFYPYAPPTATSVQRTLNAETAATKRAGFPIKVALIAAPTDLGVIPSLFGKPQQYAKFLDQEISFLGKQHLLVVMSDGYGTQGFARPAKLAAAGLKTPAGKTSTDLAQAAVVAVARLAAASGHPIKGVPGVSGTSTGGGSSTTPILIGLVGAVVVVAAGLFVLRRRQLVKSAG
jgi:LPXTG-motif cell wall-anchored protein